MTVIGQFNLGFIVARLGRDLFLVDQHASDEKYNFERLQLTDRLRTQTLMRPLDLDLTAVSEQVAIDHRGVIEANGFTLSVDETQPMTKRVRLLTVPYSKGTTFGAADVQELVFLLRERGTLADGSSPWCRPSRVRAMYAMRACRSSIMIGTALSHSQMRRVLDHMSEMDQCFNCPHGRPTMRFAWRLEPDADMKEL